MVGHAVSKIKYKLELTGTVSDGQYIEFEFGDRKIVIGENIKSALKLQELLKERIKELPDEDESWETCKPRIKYELKSLVEKSKK